MFVPDNLKVIKVELSSLCSKVALPDTLGLITLFNSIITASPVRGKSGFGSSLEHEKTKAKPKTKEQNLKKLKRFCIVKGITAFTANLLKQIVVFGYVERTKEINRQMLVAFWLFFQTAILL